MDNIKCTLMHKNIPVLDIVISNIGIVEVGNLHNPSHLPIGTRNLTNTGQDLIDFDLLNDWWTGRSIPASRDNLNTILHALNVLSPEALLVKCYGLSLSDQYWVCPQNSGLTWNVVNYFENDFSKDIGEILFGYRPKYLSNVNMNSPDNTSDGVLQKKWVISEGKRILMKGGLSKQEPFNEVIASSIMQRLNIPHVQYTLTFEEEEPYSLCENFITSGTELISAKRVMQTLKKSANDSYFTHLLRCCDNLGIPGVQDAIDKMLVLDYIIANQDRHYNNFGFIRNADTLEWLGFAPIYDSGTSLWQNMSVRYIGSRDKSKPFETTHVAQIKLVGSLEWFELCALEGIAYECNEILAETDKCRINLEQQAKEAIVYSILEGIEQIEQLKLMRRAQQNIKYDKDNSIADLDDSIDDLEFEKCDEIIEEENEPGI